MANEIEIQRDDDNLPSLFNFMPDFQEWFGEWPSVSRQVSPMIQETDDAYYLEAEIPGIPKEDLEIKVNGNLLTIRAERKFTEGREKEGRSSRQYRKVQQSFSLPTSVDADQIEANYENGVLQILLPKAADTKAKRIEVQSGKAGFIDRLFGKKEDSDSSMKPKNVKH
jgi:HSP20 family protein